MKRNATIITVILLPLLIAPLAMALAEPDEGIVINRMNVNAELYENSSVKVTIIAEVFVTENYNGLSLIHI